MKDDDLVAAAYRALRVYAGKCMVPSTGNILARVLIGTADIDENSTRLYQHCSTIRRD